MDLGPWNAGRSARQQIYPRERSCHGSDIQPRGTDRPFARLFDWFEAPEVVHFFEGMRPLDDRIRLEEEVVGDRLVIRAEMPGIDPDKDLDIKVADGALSVHAERKKEETTRSDRGFRSEFRYGSFRRTCPSPRARASRT